MYIGVIFATVFAWFVGLVLDANLGDPLGFTGFRTLFPILVMGICILRHIDKK